MQGSPLSEKTQLTAKVYWLLSLTGFPASILTVNEESSVPEGLDLVASRRMRLSDAVTRIKTKAKISVPLPALGGFIMAGKSILFQGTLASAAGRRRIREGAVRMP